MAWLAQAGWAAAQITGVPGVEEVDMIFQPFDLPAARIWEKSTEN